MNSEDKKQEIVQEMKPNVEEKKEKAPRKPSEYNEFIKKNYKKVNELPYKERFSALGKLWKETKAVKVEKKAEKKVKSKK
jgi:hypothetical protein